jgi:hypothetical protein
MNAILLIIAFFVVTGEGFSRIRNGYSRQIQATKSALHSLKLQLKTRSAISGRERRRLEAKIESLISYISCYELTEELIARMKTISPSIFWDIENIRDRKGRPTDVYIKLIPADRARVNLKAATFVSQSGDDQDACCSEYGPLSVRVEICIKSNSLFLLSHELGHLKYVIPNLAVYKEFYRWAYGRARSYNLPYIGHSPQDKSGRMARQFEERFRADEMNYSKNITGELQDFVGLYSRLKRMHRDLETHHDNAVAHIF